MPSLVQEPYPPHLLSQKLNNQGCVQLKNSQYEQSIATFVRALKLSESSANQVSCSCRYCMLNSCISTSISYPSFCATTTRITPTSNTSSNSSRRGSGRIKRPIDSSTTAVFDDDMEVEEETAEQQQQYGAGSSASFRYFSNPTVASTGYNYINSSEMAEVSTQDERYLYTHALRVPSQSIKNGHNMGVTLSLIIIFNLALAHHLMGIVSKQQQQRSNSSLRSSVSMSVDTKLLQKALQLYELAYQLHVDEQHAAAAAVCAAVSYFDPTATPQDHLDQQMQQRLGMLRFTMIMSNNLGEIHRVVDNPTQHSMCLQHLLSTLMYMVDGQFLTEDESSSNTSSTSTGNNPRKSSITKEEVDGFLRNASSMILQDNCASAA
jgi:tetratricopeptide (TPR) repeat protein